MKIMKTRLLLIFAFIIVAANLSAQNVTFGWVKQIENADQPYLATDNNGNTFYASIINDLVFLGKYATNGDLIWSKKFTRNNATDGYLYIQDIDVDANGNIYLAGYYQSGSVDLNPDANENYLPAPTGTNNTFVVKLSANGDYVWAKSIGSVTSSRDVEAYSLAIDSNSNVLLTGYFEDTVDFNPGAGEELITAQGGLHRRDMYIVKLDNLGNYQWVRTIGKSNENCNGYIVNTDANNNVYVLGNFKGNIDFDHSSNTTLLRANNESGYIIKYKPNGDFDWAKDLEIFQTNADYEYAKTDAEGNTYIINNFGGSFDFDLSDTGTSNITSRGDDDVVTSKYDSDGNFVWANQIGGTGRDRGYGIAVNQQGVYVTGFFNDTIDLDSNQTGEELTSNGEGDIFVVQFDVNGNFFNATQVGNFANDFGQSISIDANGGVYSAGEFVGQTTDLDPTSGSTILNSLNGRHYVQKLQFPVPNPNNNTYTAIPDTNFEQYLIDQNIDSENVLDGKILTTDIEAIETLDIRSKTIADLTGIQDFTALTTLNATNNTIASLDVSQNLLLETLFISQNQLTAIDLSKNENLKNLNLANNLFTTLSLSANINLESLNFASNTIASIDFSSNTKLKNLYIGNNSLQNIDVSMLADLTILWCFNNQLSALNTSNNPKLESLDCGTNQLTTLNVDNNIALTDLFCNSNQLTALNLSSNTTLTSLNCEQNSIVYLDMSANKSLTKIRCNDNALIGLNMQNGNNNQVLNEDFSAFANPNLFCVQVDENYSQNWSQIDMQTELNTVCPALAFIPDANFEAYLESINVGNGTVGDFYVNKELIESLTTLNIETKNIADLTGIENFTNLKELNANNNNITHVNFSQNTNLEQLLIANNQLSALDLSNNLSLKILDIGENQFTEIAVHFLSELESLSVYKNQLTTINLLSNKKLLAFVANENQLKTVDIRANTALVWIDVDDNLLENLTIKNGNNAIITQFSATGNPNLTCIEVDDVSFSETNFTEKDATANFSGDCAPANDDCAFAIPLVIGQSTPGDINSGAFTNATDCVAGPIIADVWYSITVPETGEFSIEGQGFGGLLKFALYESCASVSSVSCGLNISLTNLTPGTIYYLKVWMEESGSAKSNSESGTFTLTASKSSVLSVDDFSEENTKLLVYPNPATSNISIELSNNVTIEKVFIYSILGDKISTQNGANNSKIKVDVSNLSAGIYFIKAKTDNGIVSKKLIIN